MFRPKSTLRSLVLLAAALCAAQTASSGPPASAKEAEFGRFVISGTVSDAAQVDVMVEDDLGQPLDGGLYDLKDGAFESTLPFPLGVSARIHIKALDQKGEKIAESSVLAQFNDLRPAASQVRLESRSGESLGTVVVSPVSLKLTRIETFETGLMRYEVRAADVDGRAIELPAEQVNWSVKYPEKISWMPCASGGACIEFRVPVNGKLIVRPELNACVQNNTCLFGAFDPTPSQPVNGYRAISAGNEHACALTFDGRILCWGNNANSRLGRTTSDTCSLGAGPIAGTVPCGKTPQEINCPGGGAPCRYVALDAGLSHTCAIDTAGAAWCWGDNMSSQLGFRCAAEDKDPNCKATATPRKVIVPFTPGEGVPVFSSVSAGVAHTCAVSTLGNVYCWGANFDGQLGSPGLDAPRIVPSSNRYATVSAGFTHTCAVVTSGDLDCWGTNVELQIRPFNTSDTFSPTSVRGFHPGLVGKVTRVATNRFATCAHADVSGVVCWGNGIAGDNISNSATQMADLELGLVDHAPNVSSWTLLESCAITSGTVLCGSGAATLAQVSRFNSGFTDGTVGDGFECAVRSNGNASCWGVDNRMGQMGDGSTVAHATPGRVLGP